MVQVVQGHVLHHLLLLVHPLLHGRWARCLGLDHIVWACAQAYSGTGMHLGSMTLGWGLALRSACTPRSCLLPACVTAAGRVREGVGHLGEGHVLLSLQVKLGGIGVRAAHALDCPVVGLDVDDVPWLHSLRFEIAAED